MIDLSVASLASDWLDTFAGQVRITLVMLGNHADEASKEWCVRLPEWVEGLEWTTGIDCCFDYFLCSLLGQSGLELPQKEISPRNMQFRYQKNSVLAHILLPGLLLQCLDS